jgi:hypothetical protein
VFLNTKPPHGQEVREPYEIKTTYPDGNWIGKKTGTIFIKNNKQLNLNYVFKF